MNHQAVQADTSVAAVIGQVADEFTQRLNRGERPTIEEYVEKHPEIAELLRQVLEPLKLLRRPDVKAALADGDPNLAEPLGDFRLVRQIGQGGMGIVYEAIQLSLNKTVAVKVLPFAAALDPRQLQRFKNEALAAASLQHEHIVQVFFVGCERGVHFYAMQFIEGLSLADVIAELRRLAGGEPTDPDRTVPYSSPTDAPSAAGTDTLTLAALTTEGSMRSPMYFRTVARLIEEAAEGLGFAHQKGVYHRDIKPGNLLVDGRGNLWITDFGLAQMRSDTRLTMTGELVGTLRYMSPEQALAKRVPVDGRTDVYSLGATLYELLTLEPVFGGKDRQELLRQIAFDDPRPPRRLNPLVHRDLEAVCLKCLEKDPRRRYPSAGALAADLRRWRENKPTVARPLSRAGRVWRAVRRRPFTSAFVAVLLAAAVAFPIGAYQLDPERVPKDNLGKLKRGQDVTLIRDTGAPEWWKPVIGAPEVVEPPAHDGTFSFNSRNPAYLELMPVAPASDYCFRIKVRHDDQGSGEDGEVGVYLLRSAFTTTKGVEHAFCVLRFNEWGDVCVDKDGKPAGRLAVEIRRRRFPGRFNAKHDLAPFWPIPLLGRQTGLRPGWHDIVVEVTTEALRFFWDGKVVGEVALDQLAQTFQEELNPRNKPALFEPALNPSFVSTGGLGIFVENGWASFRDAVVGPLDKARKP